MTVTVSVADLLARASDLTVSELCATGGLLAEPLVVAFTVEAGLAETVMLVVVVAN